MKRGLQFVLLMFLVLLCGVSFHGVVSQDDMYGTSVCNGTISECLDENEEFLMDSETSKRHLLASGGSPSIAYPALQADKTGCNNNGKPYGSCLPGPNGKSTRGCKEIYYCKNKINDHDWSDLVSILYMCNCVSYFLCLKCNNVSRYDSHHGWWQALHAQPCRYISVISVFSIASLSLSHILMKWSL